MTTTDKAALLRRAAERMACPEGASCPHPDCRQGNADSAALTAWAAEMEAADKWLDAPDAVDYWEAGAPDQDAVMMDIYRSNDTLWATLPSGTVVEMARWIADHPDWRYRRRAPVIVPPREVTP